MLFNSISFLIFFPVVTLLYFWLEHRYRWMLLLAASCIFYTWFIPKYILILALTIVIDYFAGILIEDSTGRKKKMYLYVSILSTCLVLFVFKYFNFFNSNLFRFSQVLGLNYSVKSLNFILPIGLSFHTFQSLAYVIEVYRGKQKAERHFGIYSLFVMFYPQLVAGPIERPQNLLHQFYEKHEFDYERVTSGLKLIAWGLFKKIVIADRLSVFVNRIYDQPTDYRGVPLLVATVFFAFQIYCDFSGYSDIAIGTAQVMGFKLMDNFNRPYFAKSISEFWKRWHISLSTWFKDYLYISLGGNRCSRRRWQMNLFFTFVISGLWHGSHWTYVIWGALNGFYLVFSIRTEATRHKIARITRIGHHPKIRRLFQVFCTFTLICFSWIFFRARTVPDALYIVRHILEITSADSWNYFRNYPDRFREFIYGAFLIIALLSFHLVQRHGSIRQMLATRPRPVRWAFYYALVFLIYYFRSNSLSGGQFIYFQF